MAKVLAAEVMAILVQKMKTRKTKYCLGDPLGGGVGELTGKADVKYRRCRCSVSDWTDKPRRCR